ncbi:MAG: ABC transporter ATP-binding protein [Planctomycetota bacterium]
MNSQAVISTVGLTKVFKDFWRRARVRAVNDLDLQIQPGEIFGLLGPNGSGKSTTIKMILGLLHPTRGHVSVFNRPPEDVRIKARIGYLPEESYLYRFLNARETLHYYGTLFQIPRAERRRRTEELLDMVGLRSAARRPVGEYSKGMARRIGLAQALINDPDLLILDEPTSGLDPIGSKLVKEIILRLGRDHNKTILLSSHLLADVEEVCDRVTILYGGRAQVAGRIEDVLSHRDRLQINCERLAPETVSILQDIVQQREGKSLEITTPRDRLETLFLRIVQQALAEKVETEGSAVGGDIAGFLGQDEELGEAVLESLVKVDGEPTLVEPAESIPAVPAGVDEGVLSDLTTGATPAVDPETPTVFEPSPAEEVDHSLLDGLTSETERKDEA